MSWRTIVISKSSKLDYHMGFLVVRQEDIVKIHVDEIYLLLIESTAVSITAALLCELIKRKIKVVFCDEKRNPISELLAYHGSHDSSEKIRKQISWSKDIKLAVWTEIVSQKIKHQMEHLSSRGLEQAKMLGQYIDQMEFGDVTNREGHAAKVYFNALFGLDFTRSMDNSVNAALNYGYSILLSAVNREISANGYLTQLGLFHDNMFNPFNLGSDLMEPFRPIVDDLVRTRMPKCFEQEEKHYMLSLMETEVRIANRMEYLNNAIKIYCKSVFDALENREASLIEFFKYEF